MSIGHHIQDRGHVVEKKLNKKTGEKEFVQDFQNLDECTPEWKKGYVFLFNWLSTGVTAVMHCELFLDVTLTFHPQLKLSLLTMSGNRECPSSSLLPPCLDWRTSDLALFSGRLSPLQSRTTGQCQTHTHTHTKHVGSQLWIKPQPERDSGQTEDKWMLCCCHVDLCCCLNCDCPHCLLRNQPKNQSEDKRKVKFLASTKE